MKEAIIQAEQVALWLLTSVSGFVAFLHLVGLLEHGFAERIPSLTLLCVALVVSSLALQQRAKIDNLERLIADTTDQQRARLTVSSD